MPPPRFASSVVMGDDAFLLAEITTLIARRTAYLPVLNGPRRICLAGWFRDARDPTFWTCTFLGDLA